MEQKDEVAVSAVVPILSAAARDAVSLRRAARQFYERSPLEESSWRHGALFLGERHVSKLAALVEGEARRLGLQLRLVALTTSPSIAYQIEVHGFSASIARFLDYLASVAEMLPALERS